MILSKRNVTKFIITINIIYALSEILLMTVYETNFYFSWKAFTTFGLKIGRVNVDENSASVSKFLWIF